MSAPVLGPTRRPTMKDVAALSGVSLKTVSRVVNAEPLVSADVVARVTAAIDQLRYRPDDRAGSLRRTGQRVNTIGLLVSSTSNPFAVAVHRAVEVAVTRERDVAVIASSADELAEFEQRTVEMLLRRRVDGLILTPMSPSQAYLRDELRFGTPVVAIDRTPVGIDVDCVLSDHIAGAAAATEHLLARGHRRIAFLGDLATIQSAASRRRGFLDALGARGVPSGSCPVVMDLHSEEAAARATVELLRGEDPPTAIVGGQNLVTVGVVRALRELGLQRSTALVGFDDLPLAEFLDPAITVVAQDPEAVGRIAVERLFARLEGDASEPGTVLVPTTLIPRGSGELPVPEGRGRG